MAIGAGEGAPVEPAEVVAGGVFAVLGELDVEAVERAAMLAADGPLDEPVATAGSGPRSARSRQDRNISATAASSAPFRIGMSFSSFLMIVSLVSPVACAL